MSNLAKISFLSVFVFLSACAGPPVDQGALEINLSKSGDLIALDLVNNSANRQEVSSGFVYAGKSIGNVHTLIVSDLGKIYQACAPMDTPTVFWKKTFMGPGGSVEIWRGTPQHLATFSCLEKGQYTVVFGYQKPSGEFLFSRPLKLIVSGERNQKTHYLDATAEMGKAAAIRESN